MIHEPLKPMLLHKSDLVPAGSYIHQLKYDGFRCLFSFDSVKGVKLFTRHGNNCTRQFCEFQSAKINVSDVIFDGEMIAVDENGTPDFESVMSRLNSRRASNIPTHFVAFDLLYVNGEPKMHLPLERRLELLNEIVTPSSELSVAPVYDNGNALFESAIKLNLEGIVSKKIGSKYKLDTRSKDWQKVKNYQYENVQIRGIRKGEFGWSLMKDGQYVGVMEFVPPAPRKTFKQFAKQIMQIEDKNWIYLDPVITVKVKFQSYTKAGLMRSPSFVEFVV